MPELNTADTAVSPAAPERPEPKFSLSRIPTLATVGVFLVVVVAAFGVFAPNFWTVGNAGTIIITASVIMLASLGQLLVVISGGFDLSIGGVLPLSAVVFALLTTAGLPLILAAAICLVLGVAVGLIHTFFIVYLKINPLIATLATMSITAGLAFTLANGQTLTVPAEAGLLGDRAIGTLPWHVIVMVILVIVMHIVLAHTSLGRRIYMVGGNGEAARLAGIRVTAIGGSVYVFSGFFAALAGIVMASQLLASNGGMGSTITMQSLAAVVLGGAALTGGRGSVPGAVIGVLLLGVIANGMSILHVPTFYQQVVTGLVLLAAVTLSRLQERSRRSA